MSNINAGRTCMVTGRIVWTSGDLFKGRTKVDFNTKQPKLHAVTGEQMKEYGFGLAVPKTVLQEVGPGQEGEVWTALHEEAYTLYPSRQIPPGFAMKFKDGDTVNKEGKPYPVEHKGCIVLACTMSIPIKFFTFENGNHIMVNEGINAGDYVRVQLSIKAHGAVGQGNPGLYLNPNAVQLVQKGEAIINTPSGEQIFGSQAPALSQHIVPVLPQAPAAMPGVAAPAYAAPPAFNPAEPLPSHYAVLPPAHQPAAAVMPAATLPPMQAAVQPVAAAPMGMPAPPR
jgi:hypothetical protein